MGARGMLILIAAAGFASSASMRILEPILPLIGREFSRSADEVALLSVVFTAAYALSQPVLGPIGDSQGKIRVILACLAVLAGCTWLAARAESFSSLLVLRAVSGAFAGGIIPLCLALYGDLVAFKERHLMLSRFMIASVSGQIVGSTLSGILAEFIGWRGVLGVAAIFGFLAAVALGAAAFRFDEKRKPLSFAGAVAGYRQVLANPRALPLFSIVAVEGVSVYGLFPYVASILEHRSGMGSSEAGFVVAGFAVGGIAFGLLAKGILKRLGPPRMTIAGGALMLAMLAVFALNAPLLVLIASFVGYGFGFYCWHTTLQTQATELAAEARGSALGLFAASLFVGVAVGPLVFGQLMRLGDGFALISFGVISAAAAAVTPRLLRLA